MSNQFLKLRRSSVPGKIPTTSSLEFGEIALNTYDGLAFIKKSGSNGEEVIAIGATATISGSEYFIPVFSGSGVTESTIFQSGSFTSIRNAVAPQDPANPDILYVNGDGVNTYNLISAHGNINNYIQTNVQNFNNSTNASSDIVATADNGTESTNYIDMGINSSGYDVNSGVVGGQNDAYLYSTGENLLIGNVSPGKKIVLFNGGLNSEANARLYIHEQGTVSINTNTYNTNLSPALEVQALNLTTTNIINAYANNDDFVEVAVTNASSTTSASADFVAYNDIDPGNQEAGYIDMGINSTVYAPSPDYPGQAGDAYLYTDSEHLVIGAISQSGATKVTIFAGGVSEEANAKLVLYGSNQHVMTGSLEASQGFTGSLYGTASWALNTLTASYVANAVSAAYAATASSADNFFVRQDITASNALFTGTITAQRLNVQYITASTEFVTGSTKFGSQLTDTHQFTGSVSVTGSLTVNGPLNATASWAQNAVSASYVPSTAIVGDISRIATGSVTASVNVSSIAFQIVSSSTAFLTVNNSGNISIGPTNPANARLYVSGTVSISSNGSVRFTAVDSNTFDIQPGSLQGDTALSFNAGGGRVFGYNSSRLAISHFNTGNDVIYLSRSALSFGRSSSTALSLSSYGTFAPTSSNQSFQIIDIRTEYSASSAVTNGTLTGIYYNPTLTSLTGSIHRAIHTFTGDVILGSVTGSVGIGTTTPAFRLDVSGNGRFTSDVQITGSLNAPSITGSLFGTASWALNAVTASYVPSTAIVGDISRIATGSVTASVGVGTGSFQLTSGSSTFLFVSNSGDVNITSTLSVATAAAMPSGYNIQSSTGIYSQNRLRFDSVIRDNRDNDIVQQSSNSVITNRLLTIGNATYSNISFPNGNLLVGANTGSNFKLDVSGSGRFTNNVEVTGSMNITGSLSVSGAVSTNAGFYVSNNSMNFGPNGANSLSLGNSAGSLSLSSTVLSLGSNTTTQTNLYGLISINSSSLSAGIAVQANQAVNNTSGWQNVVASPTASYKAAFFDYVAFSGSIGRAGTVTTFWSASATEFYENYTEDLGGSTTGVVLQTAISASQIVLQATASSAAWTIRSLVRLL